MANSSDIVIASIKREHSEVMPNSAGVVRCDRKIYTFLHCLYVWLQLCYYTPICLRQPRRTRIVPIIINLTGSTDSFFAPLGQDPSYFPADEQRGYEVPAVAVSHGKQGPRLAD